MANATAINFHNEKMAQERERVMLRIQNGLKSDTSAIIANRMAHPSFRGMVDNSTGSKNVPFFITKDESGTSLESKIKNRNGMIQPRNVFLAQQSPLLLQTKQDSTDQIDLNPNIIASPFIAPRTRLEGGVLKDFNYAKRILNQRKKDIENQILNEQGLPRNAPDLTILSDIDSKKLELANVLDYVGNEISVGNYNVISSLESRSVIRLIIALSSVFTEDEIVTVIRILENIIKNLSEGIRDGIKVQDVEGKKRQLERTIDFLRKIARVINQPVMNKVILATALARDLGSFVGLNATLKNIEEVVADKGEEIEDVMTTTLPMTVESSPEEEAEPEENEMMRIRESEIQTRLNQMYANDDVIGLQELLRELDPSRNMRNKALQVNASRTVVSNAINQVIRKAKRQGTSF